MMGLFSLLSPITSIYPLFVSSVPHLALHPFPCYLFPISLCFVPFIMLSATTLLATRFHPLQCSMYPSARRACMYTNRL